METNYYFWFHLNNGCQINAVVNALTD